MNYFVMAIVAVTGIALGMYMARRGKTAGSASAGALNDERAAAKQAAVEKVFAEIQQKGSITNDGVQALLGVSDATAERYLQELETAGRINQVGDTGKNVSYKVA
ncbi:MAG: winged helix-turn-helix transcriptional regulator [bacterium]|nr:winged helix-turn-helix transcriptional regulator [bacterium]